LRKPHARSASAAPRCIASWGGRRRI